jgi:arylsulfatase A-like enzyme
MTWRSVGVAALWLSLGAGQQPPPHTQLVIVVDGLRPDYVTADVMPRLTALGRRGTVFSAHHSVFPTVTRVNASTFVTGVYPEAHGLMGNTIYIPSVSQSKVLDTAQRESLEAVERADGRLLTAPTLSEIFHSAGKTLLAVSSGSSGSALLLNHTVATGGIIHSEFFRPPAIAARATEMLGPAPPHAVPNDPQNQYAVDAYLKVGLDYIHPDVTFMWLSEPDTTAHANGIGSPLTRQALTLVDEAIGRVEDTLRAKELLDRTNIVVTSDHGFSTHTGGLDLASQLQAFAQPLPDGSPDIIVAEGAIYFRSPLSRERLSSIVSSLQNRPEVGAIFTRAQTPGRPEGIVTGTLSFDLIHWNHPTRSAEILVSPNWSREKNTAGFAGATTAAGVAGHGSSSPYDVHNTLIAAGPDFRQRAVSQAPSGNVDIAATLLRLEGLPVPRTMAGRVLDEGLRKGTGPQSPSVTHATVTVTTVDRSYELTAYVSAVQGRRYLDYTEVKRK